MKKKQQKDTHAFERTAGQHSLVCNDALFYTGLRAAAEDSEVDKFTEKK